MMISMYVKAPLTVYTIAYLAIAQENLTPETTRELLNACQKNEAPKMTKWGSLPMNGQLSCEGPQGKTSLLWSKHPEPGFRMRPDTELQAKVDPKKIKEEMLY